MKGGGDRLASGAIKASFGPVEKISDERWAEAFDDLDLKRFLADEEIKQTGIKEHKK